MRNDFFLAQDLKDTHIPAKKRRKSKAKKKKTNREDIEKMINF